MLTTSTAARKIVGHIPRGSKRKMMAAAGFNQRSVYSWTLGEKSAGFDNMVALAQAAGLELVLVEKDSLDAIRDHVL